MAYYTQTDAASTSLIERALASTAQLLHNAKVRHARNRVYRTTQLPSEMSESENEIRCSSPPPWGICNTAVASILLPGAAVRLTIKLTCLTSYAAGIFLLPNPCSGRKRRLPPPGNRLF